MVSCSELRFHRHDLVARLATPAGKSWGRSPVAAAAEAAAAKAAERAAAAERGGAGAKPP
jgi:hypothetical protein